MEIFLTLNIYYNREEKRLRFTVNMANKLMNIIQRLNNLTNVM